MRKNILFSFCFFIVMILVGSSASFVASAAENTLAVSHGIFVVAEDNSMAMAGMVGNKIGFESEDFERALNVSKIGSITVTEVPPITDGELLMGSTVVNRGQTISAANIALLSYSAKSENVSTSYFRFMPEGAGYEVRCDLYMLDALDRKSVV